MLPFTALAHYELYVYSEANYFAVYCLYINYLFPKGCKPWCKRLNVKLVILGSSRPGALADMLATAQHGLRPEVQAFLLLAALCVMSATVDNCTSLATDWADDI